MQERRLAVQLYTLRDHMKTPDEIVKTLKRVRDMGYQGVELAGLGPLTPHEIKSITDDLGLKICSTHISCERVEKDPEGVLEEHRIYGCRYIGIAGLSDAYRSAEGYHNFAVTASRAGAAMAREGFVLIYHNHSFELERYGSRTGLDMIYEDSDPTALMAEIDTYWIQHGGADPIRWINKLSGRLPVVHLKEMAVRGGESGIAEIGEGNLNWEGILSACRQAEVDWYVVEQDTNFLVDPFTSVQTSYDNLMRI